MELLNQMDGFDQNTNVKVRHHAGFMAHTSVVEAVTHQTLLLQD